jgi:hypothetical protein
MTSPADVAAPVARTARWLMAASGATFLAVGGVFFIAPGAAADNFPWGVTPFEAMTIGGWAIGTGLIAIASARRWDVGRMYPGLLYLWTFCILQLVVVVAFASVLRTDHWLTWPYLLPLVLGLASAVGLPDVLAARATVRGGGGVPGWVTAVTLGVVLLLVLLSVGLLLRSSAVDGRTVFPDALSLFTVRAFSAFFISLLVGVASLFATRDPRTFVALAQMGLYLVVPITVAALLYVGEFDFVARPGGLIYIGVYVLIGAIEAGGIWWYRRRLRRGAI